MVEQKSLNNKISFVTIYLFYILKENTVKSMGDFREKTIQSGFPAQS